MPFTDDQINALDAPLNRSNIKSRTQAGRELSYIEGWHAIKEANRIFGFSEWDRETTEIKLLGTPRMVGDKARVGYMAKVRITVRTEGGAIIREGCGFGSGIDRDVDQAHESAIKEAETDAMKRALMTFGNPFGLALYDKDQRDVAEEPSARDTYKAVCREVINDPAKTFEEIAAWWNADAQKKARHDFEFTKDDVEELKALVLARQPAREHAA